MKNLIVILISVVLMSCAPSKMYITYHSNPQGATLSNPMTGEYYGRCPVKQTYEISKENRADGYVQPSEMKIEWPSGHIEEGACGKFYIKEGIFWRCTFTKHLNYGQYSENGHQYDLAYGDYLTAQKEYEHALKRYESATDAKNWNQSLSNVGLATGNKSSFLYHQTRIWSNSSDMSSAFNDLESARRKMEQAKIRMLELKP